MSLQQLRVYSFGDEYAHLVIKLGVCKVPTAEGDTIHLSSPTVCQRGCFSRGQYER